MLGSSRESLRAVSAVLAARADDAAFARVGGELLQVAALLGGESTLRSSLSDSGTPLPIRTGVVDQLFGSKLAAVTVDVLKSVVEQRWSSGRDFVDAVDQLAAEALFTIAEREGRIDAVEDELFRFGRAVSSSGDLFFALTAPALGAEHKTAIVHSLLDGRAEPETLALLTHVVTATRGRTIEDAVGELVEVAAIRRQHVAAEVTSAIALTPEQQTRLASALARIYGREVDIRTTIDPDVIGGISVRVGDEVIDGTTAHRLEQARRRMVS